MPSTSRQRRAFSLVEVIAATAIMAVLTTASFALVRTANNAWMRHRDDSGRRREAVVAMQHMMRRIRQATRVTAISAAADASGGFTLMMADGTFSIYDHSSGLTQILYGTSTANNVLATGITELTVTGLKANGTATTTQLDLIHALRCTIKYTITRPSGTTTETMTCTAWLRAW